MAKSAQQTPASQLGADILVRELFPEPGFFVDVGAADGYILSNTASLEEAGWRGIAVDPLAKNFDTRKRTQCFQAAVYSHAGLEVDFVVCSQDANLSGIANELCTYRSQVLGTQPHVHRMKTVLLSDLLTAAGAPPCIEYLSLDTEGSELAILSTFPFDRWMFGFISVEHNYEEPKRGAIRALLSAAGYMHVAGVAWDDWYVHASLAGPRLTIALAKWQQAQQAQHQAQQQ